MLDKCELQTYPDLFSRTLPFLLECAKEENVSNAKMAFQRYCPNVFKIEGVQWQRKRHEPYCSWHVKYVLQGLALLPDEGEQLQVYFSMLEKHWPPNSNILDVTRWSNAAILEYGVIDCQCEKPVFNELARSPVQSQLGIINKELENLKIIDENKIMQ